MKHIYVLVIAAAMLLSISNVSYSQTVTVSGKVQYTNGQPISDATVSLQNTTNYHISYTVRSDVNGNYSVTIDTGAYYFIAEAFYIQGNILTYRRMYYDNTQSFDSAKVAIFNTDTTNINFDFPVLTICTISGTIRDAATQKPLSNVFIAVNSIENHDSTFIGTDQNGNYSLSVFEGSYLLYAYETGYFMEYYHDAYNSFDATLVKVTKDSSTAAGIDFDMVKPDPGSNSISGNVGDPMPLAGVEVYAIPMNGGGSAWTGTKSGMDGSFVLQNLKNGKYVLLFYKDGYASQYYGDSVNTINLTGNTNLRGIFVVLNKLNDIGGQITGLISSDSNVPLSGTLVVAVNSSGDTISTAVSNYTGLYNIPSLSNGAYTVIANKIGYAKKSYPQQVGINLSSNPIANGINISITPTAIDKTESSIPDSYKLDQNYPNPFNPSTVISYQIPAGNYVTLKIYDVLGNEISTLVNKYEPAGNYKVSFDAAKLSSGIYFYQLSSGSFITTKKMVLIK